ncbi:unnamed protein product [Sympodiomycopsis kandeliae]
MSSSNDHVAEPRTPTMESSTRQLPALSPSSSHPQSPYVLITPSGPEVDHDQPYLPPSLVSSDAQGTQPQRQKRNSSNATGRTRHRSRTASQLSTRASRSANAASAREPRPRPRFWIILALIVLIDAICEGYVGYRVIIENSDIAISPGSPSVSKDKKNSQKIVSLAIAILGAGAMRCMTISVVAIGNKTDQLGLTVAAICALSVLITVSVFNLLFQSGMLFYLPEQIHLPEPTLSLLTSTSLVFTLVEYVAYVLVVGIRVPPNGVSAARMREARRWKRGVRESGLQYHAEDEEEEFPRRPQQQQQQSSSPFLPKSAGRRGSGYGTMTQESEAAGPSRSPSNRSPALGLQSVSPRSSVSQSQGPHTGSLDLEVGSPGSRRGGTPRSTDSRLRSREGSEHVSQTPQQSHSPTKYHDDDQDDDDSEDEEEEDQRAIAADTTEETEEEEEDDDEEEEDDFDGQDPNEILDIPPTSTNATKEESRARLALAMNTELRRSRTASMISRHEETYNNEEEPQVEEATTTTSKKKFTRPRFSLPFSSSSSSSGSQQQQGRSATLPQVYSPLGTTGSSSSKGKKSGKLKSYFSRK